jgi:heterodisulfide reductase subunit A-like polyferredoxin
LEFLKAINRGEQPPVGKRVIVIGCGNSGMDVALGAYQMGAEEVICVDIQQPAAFPQEIAHVEAMGGKLLWPVFTKEVTPAGIVTQSGELIKGDMVIISIGEACDLSFLPEGMPLERGCLKPNKGYTVAPGIFAVGDTIRPGRLVDAVGSGREAALQLDAWLQGQEYQPQNKTKIASTKLEKAYFARCHVCDTPKATDDHTRCISCGTCRDCQMCYKSCPEKAISRKDLGNGKFEYSSDSERCIGCGICAGICPSGIWTMYANTEPIPG